MAPAAHGEVRCRGHLSFWGRWAGLVVGLGVALCAQALSRGADWEAIRFPASLAGRCPAAHVLETQGLQTRRDTTGASYFFRWVSCLLVVDGWDLPASG